MRRPVGLLPTPLERATAEVQLGQEGSVTLGELEACPMAVPTPATALPAVAGVPVSDQPVTLQVSSANACEAEGANPNHARLLITGVREAGHCEV